MSSVTPIPQFAHHELNAKNVVVVGGRACGTAAVVHLANSLTPGSCITVIDPRDSDYPSVFDDVDPLLITNTSHQINSIYPERPGDFLEFLGGTEASRSVPRSAVGKYCRARLIEARKRAVSRGIQILEITDRVRSAAVRPDGYILSLGGGDHVRASDIVIAIGLGDVQRTSGMVGIPPYPSTRLRRAAKRNALVIGQGQSGIDAALVLCDAGSRVTMCSRTGQFPAVRTRTPFHKFQGGQIADGPADFRRLVDEDCRRRGYAPLCDQLIPAGEPVSMLRAETYLAEQDLCPWQDSIVGLIVALADAGVAVATDKEFLWRYVTSINLPIAHRLLARIDEGSIRATTIESLDTEKFDLVVEATGFSPPPLYHQGRDLHFGDGDSRKIRVNRLSRDLRLVLSDTHGPERIWAIGPASGIGVPFANFLHTAARQASLVAKQIAHEYVPM